MKIVIDLSNVEDALVELDYDRDLLEDVKYAVREAIQNKVRELVGADPRILQAANITKDKIFEVILPPKEDDR